MSQRPKEDKHLWLHGNRNWNLSVCRRGRYPNLTSAAFIDRLNLQAVLQVLMSLVGKTTITNASTCFEPENYATVLKVRV